MNDRDLTTLARRLGRACLARKLMVGVAESCTGGGVAEAITRIPGSSAWFERGFVTYTNDAKRELLGVPAKALTRFGAVSGEVAQAMARGVLRRSPCRVSVAVTGVAGPGGGTRSKPVGLVWFAWAVRSGPVQAYSQRFRGGRLAIRRQSVAVAIQGLIEIIGPPPSRG
jgi:nicotinamide-nucleotide amidase